MFLKNDYQFKIEQKKKEGIIVIKPLGERVVVRREKEETKTC